MSASATDWTVLDIEGVTEVISKAAQKVANQYASTAAAEYDDLYQEGLIIAAQHADLVRQAIEDHGLGRVHHFVWCDLVDLVKTEAKHLSTRVSWDQATAPLAD